MPAMAVILTCRVPARHLFGILVRMSPIPFSVPARNSQRSPLFSAAHHVVAFPITFHPLIFPSLFCVWSHYPKLGMPWDSCCCGPSR